MILKLRLRIVWVVSLIIILLMDLGHPGTCRLTLNLLFLAVLVESLVDIMSKHVIDMLGKVSRSTIHRFERYSFVKFWFSWRCPGNEGFHMWSPIEVGIMDIIDIIRKCIYTIWCKVVIQIIILFIMYTSIFIYLNPCFDV